MSDIKDLEKRLSKLKKKKEKTTSDIERLKGRREVAIKNLDLLKTECVSKGLDPNKLEETIIKLKNKLKKKMEEAEEELDEISDKIKPLVDQE